MNKTDLINTAAETAGVSKNEAKAVIDATFDAIGKATRSGDSIRLPGFGTFSLKSRGPRQARNPRTGEPISIGATSKLAFKPSKIA